MSNKPTAYVVEDNPDLAAIFAEAITSAGYNTMISHNGEAALTSILASPPNLIMLDLHLPGMMGDEIFRAIRSNEATQETRVIIASADSRLADSLRGSKRVVFIDKPVGFAQLRHLAQRLITMV